MPGHGTLVCDVRGFDNTEVRRLADELPDELAGVRLDAAVLERFPGMDTSAATASWLAAAAARLQRPVHAVARGGSSDACHLAQAVKLTVDGLGPLGGGDHGPHEHVRRSSFAPAAQLALTLAGCALDRRTGS